TSPSCRSRHARQNSIRWKTSGCSCAIYGSQTGSSEPMTISSI
ncbi:hypothetical protein ATR1_188d0001, partial [Acetobacter tropicalis]